MYGPLKLLPELLFEVLLNYCLIEEVAGTCDMLVTGILLPGLCQDNFFIGTVQFQSSVKFTLNFWLIVQ